MSQRLFLRGLFVERNLRFKIAWAGLIVGRKFTVFALFYFFIAGNLQVQAPLGGLYMEGLIFGILRYLKYYLQQLYLCRCPLEI